MIVKVCGLTRGEDARAAREAGATKLGVVFAPASKRRATVAQARDVVDAAGPTPVFAVVQNQPIDEVLALAADSGVHGVQLHGGYEPSDVVPLRNAGLKVAWAVPVDADGTWDDPAVEVEFLILDRAKSGAFGGTGEAFAWGDADRPEQPFLVAGGLHPGNIERAVAALRPDGIDLSSGLESSPGVKSHEKLNALRDALARIHPPSAIGP